MFKGIVVDNGNDVVYSLKSSKYRVSRCFQKFSGGTRPEYDEYPEFSSAMAMKIDVFSFGMLCLWFMFEKYLTGVLPLPDIVKSEGSSCPYEGEHRSLKFLSD
jgi:hypothetical protein